MKLNKITIAPVNMGKMVTFYNAVFQARLTPFEAFGTTLYSGELAGVELQFCPNELLGIKAEKNRQQLSFVVDNLDEVVQVVKENGGELLGDVQTTESLKACGVIDPDGNSIELTQIISA